MERFRFGEQEGSNGRKTTLNGFLAVFGAGERCHLEIAGPNGGARATVVIDKATAAKVGVRLLQWADAQGFSFGPGDLPGELLPDLAGRMLPDYTSTGTLEAGYHPGSLADPRD